MNFTIRHIGNSIIELTIEGLNTTIQEDITDNNGIVDKNMIEQLKEVINELEDHNREVVNQ
jgi:hypothetical protein